MLSCVARGQAVYPTPYAIVTIAGSYGNAGFGDGNGRLAQFYYPYGIVSDTNDILYVVDNGANTVRKITPGSWAVKTIAGMAGVAGSQDAANLSSQFNSPYGITMDVSNDLYVADSGNNSIRKITPSGANWVVTTIAGVSGSGGGSSDGTNGAASFYSPSGIALDAAGNLYVADAGFSTIRRISPAGTNWVTTTIAGTASIFPGFADGTNGNAEFANPSAITVDTAGNLYVADTGNGVIRKIAPIGTNWVTTTIAGTAGAAGSSDGTNGNAQFFQPGGIVADAAGNLFVSDSQNGTLRKVAQAGTNWVTTTLAGTPDNIGGGDGTGPTAVFGTPIGITVDTAGKLFVSDAGDNDIREGTLAILPNLTISQTAPGTVQVSWPGSFGTLQTNVDLAAGVWGNFSGTVSSSNGTNNVTMVPGVGTLFFRLSN